MSEEQSIIPLGPAGGGEGEIKEITSPLSSGILPDLSDIMNRQFPSLADKRKAVLEALGMRKPRQKYKTVKQRKLAAKKRRKERRKERIDALKRYGIEPRKRGKKLTPEQKKERRNLRGKTKRAGLREMARANPELAKKYGIDIDRFRL